MLSLYMLEKLVRNGLYIFRIDSSEFSSFMPEILIRSELDVFSFDSNQFS